MMIAQNYRILDILSFFKNVSLNISYCNDTGPVKSLVPSNFIFVGHFAYNMVQGRETYLKKIIVKRTGKSEGDS